MKKIISRHEAYYGSTYFHNEAEAATASDLEAGANVFLHVMMRSSGAIEDARA